MTAAVSMRRFDVAKDSRHRFFTHRLFGSHWLGVLAAKSFILHLLALQKPQASLLSHSKNTARLDGRTPRQLHDVESHEADPAASSRPGSIYRLADASSGRRCGQHRSARTQRFEMAEDWLASRLRGWASSERMTTGCPRQHLSSPAPRHQGLPALIRPREGDKVPRRTDARLSCRVAGHRSLALLLGHGSTTWLAAEGVANIHIPTPNITSLFSLYSYLQLHPSITVPFSCLRVVLSRRTGPNPPCLRAPCVSDLDASSLNSTFNDCPRPPTALSPLPSRTAALPLNT
jgi:hypothetical protein